MSDLAQRGAAVCQAQAVLLRRDHRLRPLATAFLGCAMLAAPVLAGCGGGEPLPTALPRADVDAALAKPQAGLTAAERALEAAAGQTLPGNGKQAQRQLDAQLGALKGTPVVVNLWGDWCTPCKKELPLFQRAALTHRGAVAFLGLATLSDRGKTERYLAEQIALPFPSILDNPGDVLSGTGLRTVPKTFFYDAARHRYVHQGPYRSAADLDADILRYAQ